MSQLAMPTRASVHWLLFLFCLVAVDASGRQVVRSGPPPEIRALFDAFTQALNSGSADTWEAFVQSRFAPALLQKNSPPQRAEMYRMLA